MRRVVIDPLTRLEGHGRVEIFLDAAGEVDNAYLVVSDLRGFERFCVGRPAEEMPQITSRICGLCPEAHHLASTKALDALFGVEPPPAARKLRELMHMASFVADHATHFFFLAGPDFLLGAEASPAERSVFGVFRSLGAAVTRQVVECRMRNKDAVALIGGRRVHPAAGLPGGWSLPLTEEGRRQIEATARANVEFALEVLALFEGRVLPSADFRELLEDEALADRTYSLGTVDAAGRLSLYDGRLRVVDPGGAEVARFDAADYGQYISEREEPWSRARFPFLRRVGWRGLVDGAASGVYCASPLARLNVADGLATPLAQERYEALQARLGSSRAGGRFRPIHQRMAAHWARLVEMLHAAERMVELATDRGITDPEVRAPICGEPRAGVGSVEAPRGTLIHDYRSDAAGLLTAVNLIAGTTHNQAPIALSLTRAARALIRGGREISAALLNRIETVVRAWDPCFSCAAHAFPGGGELRVTLRDHRGRTLDARSLAGGACRAARGARA